MDKVVLITGAGAGMGQAIALQYAELKAKLSIADIDANGLDITVQECSKFTNDIAQAVVDLTKDEEVRTLVKNTVQKFGKIDILINCAGIIRSSSVLDPDVMEVYDKVMSVNMRSIVLLTSLCAPHLIKTKGCIINIASILANVTAENYVQYSTSKAALDHFSRCTALDLAPHGVRVNAVLPGVVNSKLYTNSGLTEDQNKALLASAVPKTPLKHIIETSEIADLVLFLASEKARSITGASYAIDAGATLTGLREV